MEVRTQIGFPIKERNDTRKQLTFFLVAVRFALKQNTAIPNDSANLPYNQIRHTTCLHAWLGARSHVNIKKIDALEVRIHQSDSLRDPEAGL